MHTSEVHSPVIFTKWTHLCNHGWSRIRTMCLSSLPPSCQSTLFLANTCISVQLKWGFWGLIQRGLQISKEMALKKKKEVLYLINSEWNRQVRPLLSHRTNFKVKGTDHNFKWDCLVNVLLLLLKYLECPIFQGISAVLILFTLVFYLLIWLHQVLVATCRIF